MTPLLRITNGSYTFLGAGWQDLNLVNGGPIAAGCALVMNTGTTIAYFAMTAAASAPGSPPSAGSGPTLGNIPLPPNGVPLIFSMPEGTRFIGASAANVVVQLCEVMRT
jgi:hypothetical protein